MKNKFMEAACNVSNEYIENWKNDGKRVVGYTCSYVPDEIFYAADIMPYRIRGYGAEDMTIGDTYFGPFICSMPKCMLQLAGEGKYKFLDGTIITPGCDSMRRLDECWRKAGEDIEGVVPEFFFHYAVPHKTTQYCLDWFADETKRLIKEVENHFKVTITAEKLQEAIKVYNESRSLLDRLDKLRISENPVIAGNDALAVIIASTTIPRNEHTKLLKEFLAELEEQKEEESNKIRLMLVGSANDDVEFVRIIEGDTAVVVSDNLCFGSRYFMDYVEEDEDDPIEALTRRYISHNDCPRMYGDYKRRLNSLMEKVHKAGVEGVILQNIRFCDLHGSENGLFERDLEASGIPCMRIEREYGPLVETGRLKMRVDAFLERIEQRRKTA